MSRHSLLLYDAAPSYLERRAAHRQAPLARAAQNVLPGRPQFTPAAYGSRLSSALESAGSAACSGSTLTNTQTRRQRSTPFFATTARPSRSTGRIGALQ